MCMRRQNKDDDATSLDYRHSSLNDVPSDVFTHERTLEELHLDSNRIRDLPRVCIDLFNSRYYFMRHSCVFIRFFISIVRILFS